MMTRKQIEWKQTYRRTRKGLIGVMYDNQVQNSKQRGHKLPSYTLEELRNWIRNQEKFEILYNKWRESNFKTKKRPSIDRINDFEGYSFSNIQLMTYNENCKKVKMKQVGKLNAGAKPKEYYRTKTTTRSDFKRICEHQSWEKEEFEEVDSGEKRGTARKYYYIVTKIADEELKIETK